MKQEKEAMPLFNRKHRKAFKIFSIESPQAALHDKLQLVSGWTLAKFLTVIGSLFQSRCKGKELDVFCPGGHFAG